MTGEEVLGDPDPRWVRSARVLWRQTTTELLLLNPDGGADDVVCLTGTGAELWALLDHPLPLGRVAEVLSQRHDAEVSVVAGDVAPVLDRLAEAGLVIRLGSPS